MVIAAVFVLTIISYNSNNSVCVCLKIHVSPSNDEAAVMAARGVPIMWQKNWLARGWRKARRVCVCASAVANGAFECLFFVAAASKYGVVCVVRPPQLNIDVLIRRSCYLKPFALRGVLLIHKHCHTTLHARMHRGTRRQGTAIDKCVIFFFLMWTITDKRRCFSSYCVIVLSDSGRVATTKRTCHTSIHRDVNAGSIT